MPFESAEAKGLKLKISLKTIYFLLRRTSTGAGESSRNYETLWWITASKEFYKFDMVGV